MTEALIHNGVVVQDVAGVETEQAPAPAPAVLHPSNDLSPDDIAAAMAREISSWLMDEVAALGRNPMALVNRLLELKDPKGQKLVFTRWDVFQCFALWSKKLAGETPVR